MYIFFKPITRVGITSIQCIIKEEYRPVIGGYQYAYYVSVVCTL